MVKNVLSFLIAVFMAGSLASCMDDPINTLEPVAQNIFRPNSVGFRFLDHTPGSPTGSVRVYWSNSSSDRQENFEGYVVRVLTVDSAVINGTKIRITAPFREQIVTKTTLEAVFNDIPVGEDYIFAVWGKAFSKPENFDSLILSRDSMASSQPVVFDPRPLEDPEKLRAASVNTTTILLQWDVPSTHNQGNVLGYAVYYRDPSRLNDSSKLLTSIGYLQDTGASKVAAASIQVSPPGAQTGPGISPVKEYEFWVKAIRTDSSQFYTTDSATIRWSGGERITFGDSVNGAMHFGQGLFIGNLQGRYGAQERPPEDESVSMRFDLDGDDVVITALNGTRFYDTYHGSYTMDVAKFSEPLSDAEYTEQTLRLPKVAPEGGWIFYGKLFGHGNTPVRIFLRGNPIVTSNNTMSIELIYQPIVPGGPLPYF